MSDPQELGGPLPENYESYGTIHDPSPELEKNVQATIEMLDEVDRHVCRVGEGKPLCGADTKGDAPVYPFRGQRRYVREGLSECCDECCTELERITDDGKALTADGGRVPCPDCEHGTLRVSDGVYADCDTCDAAALRKEVGL